MFDIRKIQEQVIKSAVEAASDAETAERIVYGDNAEASAEDNASWVKSTMRRLENRFDKSALTQIRMSCQCGYGMHEKLALVRELMVGATTLEEFADNEKANAAGLFISDGELFLQFPFCPCPMLADVDTLETDTWCQCTTGYSKVLFENAFQCETAVTLLKSVKMGDDVCLMKISPVAPVWK
jgi:hypothetical protein